MRRLTKRVDAATAEDICQDVAERVLRANLRFGSVDDLQHWAGRVAATRLIDDWRTRSRHLSLDPMPDREAPIDLTTEVAYRVALAETFAAVAALRPHEREAISQIVAAPEGGPLDKRSRDRDSLRRFRARERLRRAVRNFPAGVAARAGWLRRYQPALSDLGNLIGGVGMSVAILATAPTAAAERRADPVVIVQPRVASVRPLPSPDPTYASPSALGPVDHGTSHRDDSADPPMTPPPDWSAVAVAHPAGVAKAGLVENEPDKPLACAGAAAASVCVPHVDLPIRELPVPAP
jgi:hypothetical protein